MSPLKKDLITLENKLRFLEDLRNVQRKLRHKLCSQSVSDPNYLDIDYQIEETYKEYSLLKIRYMMDTI